MKNIEKIALSLRPLVKGYVEWVLDDVKGVGSVVLFGLAAFYELFALSLRLSDLSL